MKKMTYTNLYIAFNKIKNQPHPPLPGITEADYSKPENELNSLIKQGLSRLVGEVQTANITYITVWENGQYTLSKSDSGNGHMKLLYFGGYKYLFVEHEEYSVLINYSRENEDICYKGNIHTWEYLPDKDGLYKRIGDYYMVNTYEAFCKYVTEYKCQYLARDFNSDFFRHAEEILLASETGGQCVCKNKMKSPQIVPGCKKNDKETLMFTYLIVDQLIIVVDFGFRGLNIIGGVNISVVRGNTL